MPYKQCPVVSVYGLKITDIAIDPTIEPRNESWTAMENRSF